MVAGCSGVTTVGPDASGDATGIPPGGEYWPCYFWDEVSATLEKCAPKCANRTLLGRTFWGSCEYAPGVECDPGNMTGPAGEPGSACCVYSTTPFERVDVVACQ